MGRGVSCAGRLRLGAARAALLVHLAELFGTTHHKTQAFWLIFAAKDKSIRLASTKDLI